MAMVCPQCNRAFEQLLNCPDCGGRLLYQVRSAKPALDDTPVGGDFSQWQQTPWGRLAIGLVLAQGLAYGLQHLLTAGFVATGEEVTVWRTLGGMLLLTAVQGVCLVIGGALCGAGKQRGILYGSIIGLVNGLLFLVQRQTSDEIPAAITMYGQPALHLALGALGGFIGTLIWKPIPALQVLDPGSGVKPRPSSGMALPFLAGPIHLGKVCLGIFIVVNGVVWSKGILSWIMSASQGTLEIRTHLQAQLIGWEVCALVSLIGAGLAGFGTFNGLKQGLCVGIGASIIIFGVSFGDPKGNLESTLFTVFGVLIMTMVGGWFGSQLFPPIVARRKRNRILTG